MMVQILMTIVPDAVDVVLLSPKKEERSPRVAMETVTPTVMVMTLAMDHHLAMEMILMEILPMAVAVVDLRRPRRRSLLMEVKTPKREAQEVQEAREVPAAKEVPA